MGYCDEQETKENIYQEQKICFMISLRLCFILRPRHVHIQTLGIELIISKL